MNYAPSVAGHHLLAERVRLQIMVAIAAAEESIEFVELLENLAITKGNLSSHLRRLEDAGLIEVEKRIVARKSRTSYRCKSEGHLALKHHLDELEKLICTIRPKAV